MRKNRKPEAIIGIDSGLKGAAVCLGTDRELFDILFNYPGTSHFSDVISKWRESYNIVHVYLENQHAFPGQGVSSTFTLGRVFGEILGVFSAFKVAVTTVDPRTWQKAMLLKIETETDTKVRAAETVKQLFPEASLMRTDRCKIVHDGAADALLIAEYGRKTFLTKRFEEEDDYLLDEPDSEEDYPVSRDSLTNLEF
jgi:hypothetical protein